MGTKSLLDAMQVSGPAYTNAFSRLPSRVEHNGKVYLRSDMDTLEKRLWYTAATSISSPDSVAKASPRFRPLLWEGTGSTYFLDADPGDVNAARSALAKTRSETRRIQGQIRIKQRGLDRAKAELKKAEKPDATTFLTLGISTFATTNFWSGQVRSISEEMDKLQLQLEEAKANERAAQQALNEAQDAYNAENKRIRAQEEADRQAQLQETQRARAQAAEQQRQERAQQAADMYSSMPYQDGYVGYGSAGSPGMPAFSLPGDDEVATMLEEGGAFFDQIDAIDQMHGERDYANFAFHDPGAPERWFENPSPWSFERYYDGLSDEELNEQFSFGADDKPSVSGNMDMVSNILAITLASAPAIIAEIKSPPASSDSATMEDKLKSATDKILKKSGIQDKIDDHAKKAGQAAKPDMMPIAIAILLAVILFKD